MVGIQFIFIICFRIRKRDICVYIFYKDNFLKDEYNLNFIFIKIYYEFVLYIYSEIYVV